MVRLTAKGSKSQILNYEDTFQVNVNIIGQSGCEFLTGVMSAEGMHCGRRWVI